MITAKIIADSISPEGVRLTTFALTYPRFIHAEVMTHRVFSRNAASSRAIPAKRIRAQILNDIALPVFWGSNRPGMSSKEELTGYELAAVKVLWIFAAYLMLGINWLFERYGLHKQIANRILEPWFNITVLITATEWANFYNLRVHPEAQPEIKVLAEKMLEAHNSSIPKKLKYGEWHLPYITDVELSTGNVDACIKMSVARCCRVSYLNHEGKATDYNQDLNLYNKLLSSIPMHASPSEHQATPAATINSSSGNLRGFIQYRKLLAHENIEMYKGLK